MRYFRTENDGIIPNWPLLGVVSLLDMLPFAADKLYRLSEDLSRIIGEDRPSLIGGDQWVLGEIRDTLEKMGMLSARDQVIRIVEEGGHNRIVGREQFDALIAELHRRIHDDLKRKMMYCVESDRAAFCNSEWLSGSPIETKFPTAMRELRASARLYAFGEGPASAFHSMRALEVALNVLADKFGVDFQHTNWHPVIEGIESKIRDIGKNQTKTQQIRDDEKFFGGLGRHFMFLKNGWRNHVMHVRESYTDREARQMLDHVTDLLTDMSAQLSE